MGDFRIVATASTSVISSKEEVMTFPRKDMSKVCSLCVTFNASDGSIGIYHVKAPSRTTTFGKTQLARNQKRGTDQSQHPIHHVFWKKRMELSRCTQFHSIWKRKEQALLSDISSVGRVSSDCHSLSQDFSGFKKDMILSRVESFGNRLQKDQLRIFNIWFEDQEGVVIFNRIRRMCCFDL